MGRVRSIPRLVRHNAGNYRTTKDRILKHGRSNTGRLYVVLCRNTIEETRLVHHLVAEAFIGPRPEIMECCHNDGDCTNNSASNLRYDTKISNERDKVKHGTSNRGERCAASKLTEAQARAIKEDGRPQRLIALEYGVTQQAVSGIKCGREWAWLLDSTPQDQLRAW
jgi:hypothetical protein